MISSYSCRKLRLIMRGLEVRTRSIHITALSSSSPCYPCPPTSSDPCPPTGSGGTGGGGGSCGKIQGPGPGKGKHQIKYKPYVKPCYVNHDHKNMGLNRPMSPHLTVYAPTLPAMTSIGQRATGIILTFYAVLLSGGALFLSNGVDTYVSMIQSLDMSRPVIFLLKIIVGLPFAFHYFNGVRFVMWNAGKMLNTKEVYSSARKSFIATGVLALLFALL